MDARGGQCVQKRGEEGALHPQDWTHTKHTRTFTYLCGCTNAKHGDLAARFPPHAAWFLGHPGAPHDPSTDNCSLWLFYAHHTARSLPYFLSGFVVLGAAGGGEAAVYPGWALGSAPRWGLRSPKCVSQRRTAGTAGAAPLGPALPWSGAGIYTARPDCSLEDT